MRKRELEQRDDELIDSDAKRRRSPSVNSVSTISTGASRSPSPGRRRARSPEHRWRGRSPDSESGKEGSPRHNDSRRDSPPQRRPRSSSRDSRSPPPRQSHEGAYRDRQRGPAGKYESDVRAKGRMESSPKPRDIQNSRQRQSYSSRSPEPDAALQRRRGQHSPQRGQVAESRNDRVVGTGLRAPVGNARRERSLSPFSKRLALTKNMNVGGG